MNPNASGFNPYTTGFQQGASAPYYGEEQAAIAHSGYYEQQQHGIYQNPEPTGAEYYDPSMGYGGDPYSQAPQYEDPQPIMETKPGFYYPLAQFTPTIYGYPVSALAYDDTYSAMYVATHTQPFGGRRLNHRASMLVTHSTVDGMLYSSCAGHPEASSSTLQQVYNAFFGLTSMASTAYQPTATSRAPPHAYEPPFGRSLTIPDAYGLQLCHMGITSLLPASGYVASVSPSAVRLHAKGGLCVNDLHVEGMVCGTPHPSQTGAMTHISVGGMTTDKNKSHVHTIDLYQGLKGVSSHSFRPAKYDSSVGVLCMATNHVQHNLVAGCSDGTIRMLDGSGRMRSGTEVAKVKSHPGGVFDMCISSDGKLICTTGFASKSSAAGPPYAFPDPHLLIYDVRYLGRGGIPHPFLGTQGGPRYVEFLPPTNEDLPPNRIIAASGQRGGGLQIIVPFESEETSISDPSNFLVPQLAPTETVTAMCVAEDLLAIGTSGANVLQYQLYKETAKTRYGGGGLPAGRKEFIPGGPRVKALDGVVSNSEKRPLELPSFLPPPPELSIDPNVLQMGRTGNRIGANDRIKSIFGAYIMCADPIVSNSRATNERGETIFDPLADRPILAAPKRVVSLEVLGKALPRVEGDFVTTIPTSELGINLLEDHNSFVRKEKKKGVLLPNPNKLVYTDTLTDRFFEPDIRRRTREHRRNDDMGGADIPKRYRRTLRPGHKTASHFDHSKYNTTGVWPGWDYPYTNPSPHVPSVLMMLYFVSEIRTAALAAQVDARLSNPSYADKVPPILTELGLLYHYVESISRNAMIHPEEGLAPKIPAFVPSNFLSAFLTMPEAVSLALLDDNPAVVDLARRPEAFYRFLLHHLDKELSSKKGPSGKVVDGLHGIDFMSFNSFVGRSEPPIISKNRLLTVDLAYESFLNTKGTDEPPPKPGFCDVLRHALCRETRLRAWNSKSQAYETIVQRKICTTLPNVLALSCACAGRKEEDGLRVWRTEPGDNGHWLPEQVEVEISQDGNVFVRELQISERDGGEKWVEARKVEVPDDIKKSLVEAQADGVRQHRYRLEAVLSFVRDDLDPRYGSESMPASDRGEGTDGHHVLHVRVPSSYKKRCLGRQQEQAEQLVKSFEAEKLQDRWTLTSKLDPSLVASRAEIVKDSVIACENSTSDDWILFNGFVVGSTVVEDARAFHVPFKEPCLVVFRSIDTPPKNEGIKDPTISSAVMMGSPTRTVLGRGDSDSFPGRGDMVAFDAEFVSTQEENSYVNDSGQKVILRETRYALARISLLDCRANEGWPPAPPGILVDDYVLPREPVADYLTRFSGIVANDLDPKKSQHNLISPRLAYLKLRFLLERGVIFVGHGLSQDFVTANLCVPPSQVIDTVTLYHKPGQRFISLRFLANYVLQRDMQEEVHDSIEDARAAWELYQHARRKKEEGTFDQFLSDLYEYGESREWKLRIDLRRDSRQPIEDK